MNSRLYELKDVIIDKLFALVEKADISAIPELVLVYKALGDEDKPVIDEKPVEQPVTEAVAAE